MDYRQALCVAVLALVAATAAATDSTTTTTTTTPLPGVAATTTTTASAAAAARNDVVSRPAAAAKDSEAAAAATATLRSWGWSAAKPRDLRAQGRQDQAGDVDDAEPYSFDYSVRDPTTGDSKSQWESRTDGVVRGMYSLLQADGSTRSVSYTADNQNGFRALVKVDSPGPSAGQGVPTSSVSSSAARGPATSLLYQFPRLSPGSSGPTGISGTSGIFGSAGSGGATRQPGLQSTFGSSGVFGSSGSSGSSGAFGSSGTSGSSGAAASVVSGTLGVLANPDGPSSGATSSVSYGAGTSTSEPPSPQKESADGGGAPSDGVVAQALRASPQIGGDDGDDWKAIPGRPKLPALPASAQPGGNEDEFGGGLLDLDHLLHLYGPHGPMGDPSSFQEHNLVDEPTQQVHPPVRLPLENEGSQHYLFADPGDANAGLGAAAGAAGTFDQGHAAAEHTMRQLMRRQRARKRHVMQALSARARPQRQQPLRWMWVPQK